MDTSMKQRVQKVAAQKELIQEIKQQAAAIKKQETASKLEKIKLGHLFVRLKQAAKRKWVKLLEKEIGMNRRTAQRYLALGENWRKPEEFPGPDLMDKLPNDLHKLEALSRIQAKETLRELLQKPGFEELSREAVIRAVQDKLGTKATRSEPAVTFQSVDRQLDTSFERILDLLDDFDVETIKPEGREQLLMKVEAKLREVQEALQEVHEGSADAEEGASEELEEDREEVGGAEEEGEDLEEEVEEQEAAPEKEEGKETAPKIVTTRPKKGKGAA